jgi:hypothetical protein
MGYGGYTKTGNNTSGSHEFGGANIFEHIGHPLTTNTLLLGDTSQS